MRSYRGKRERRWLLQTAWPPVLESLCGVRPLASQCQDPEVGAGWKGPEWEQGPRAWPGAQHLQEGGSPLNSDELG